MTFLFLLAACKDVEPASEEVEASTQWLYEHFDDGDGGDIAAAIDGLRRDLAADGMEDAIKTTMTSLPASAVAAVGLTAVESLPDQEQAAVSENNLESGEYVRLSDQQGILVVTVIHCSLADVETLLAARNQDEIHGGYDAYERRWDGDGDDYFARTTDRLTWTTDYTVSYIGSTYSATIEGGLRYLSSDGSEAPTMGDLVVGRAVLPDPGVFTNGNGYFRQDYQLDVLWERAAGETIHLFAGWRDLEVAGIHSSNDGFIKLVSDRNVEADEETEDLCAG